MKFMGSKRALLDGSLGPLLLNVLAAEGATRFVDLFTGSGAVAWYVAENSDVPVLAVDIQQFAVVLADSIVGRTSALDGAPLWASWRARAEEWQEDHAALELLGSMTRTGEPARYVADMRKLSAASESAPITKAYGGHYFSSRQTLWLDSLRATLPPRKPHRSVALAALVRASSRCSASPGHTAQPLNPTESGWPHVEAAWSRDVSEIVEKELTTLAARHARVAGAGLVKSASDVAKTLGEGDVAFVDPPYSAVQYSRFYHVLETIVTADPGAVSGRGRYPSAALRPRSDYSLKTTVEGSIRTLLSDLATRGVRTVLTFPRDATSLGISGQRVESIGRDYFEVFRTETNGRFSTLGGSANGRKARQSSYELLLDMRPRRASAST